MRYLAFVALLAPSLAFGQERCAPIQLMIDFLGLNHQEAPVATMDREGVLSILFASRDGKSWTLVDRVDDKFCIVADGANFRPIRWVEPARKS